MSYHALLLPFYRSTYYSSTLFIITAHHVVVVYLVDYKVRTDCLFKPLYYCILLLYLSIYPSCRPKAVTGKPPQGCDPAPAFLRHQPHPSITNSLSTTPTTVRHSIPSFLRRYCLHPRLPCLVLSCLTFSFTWTFTHTFLFAFFVERLNSIIIILLLYLGPALSSQFPQTRTTLSPTTNHTITTTMSTIQNLKNFIRHGKQARAAEPTTNVSPVHAQPQKYNNYAAQANHNFGISEPNINAHAAKQGIPQGAAGGYSTAALDNRNVAARAGDAAARAVDDQQKRADAERRRDDADPSVLERIVAEERESKGKLPRYPGLERWQLVEKMGDGAFSNVYKAKDTQGQYPEVAIKVVRKFEMNSSQVSSAMR